MGRNKKYTTKEEIDAARKKRQMEYYWRNRDERNKKNLERYYEKKGLEEVDEKTCLTELKGV